MKILVHFSPLKNGKISQNVSTYFEKSQHPDRKGGRRGVNPYGQPGRKNTIFLTTSLNFAGKSRSAALSRLQAGKISGAERLIKKCRFSPMVK